MTDVAYMAAAAMRVLGEAGSAALNWLAPLRLTTINESTDKLWAETTASRQPSGDGHLDFFPGKRFPPKDYPEDWGLDRQPPAEIPACTAETAASEPVAAEPETPRNLASLLLDFVVAVTIGDQTSVSSLAQQIADQYYRELSDAVDMINSVFGATFSLSLSDLIDLTTSSAGSAARTDESGPAAEDSPAPAVPCEPAGAGSLNLTVVELEDTALAVREHIELIRRTTTDIGISAWVRLAEKFEAAALSK